MNNISSFSSTSRIETSSASYCNEVKVPSCAEGKAIYFAWTINNFSHLRETGQYLTSPTFSGDRSEDLKWCLLLYPRGEENKLASSVILRKVSGRAESAQGKISFLNALNRCIHTDSFELVFNSKNSINEFLISSYVRHYLLDERYGALPLGKLTLICEMSVVTSYINIPSDIPINVPECHLSEDLGQLLNGQILTDVILCADGLELSAHKAILAARSPVFAAMFQHEMEEKRRNRIKIADIDQEVMREMLRYIYTGKVCNMTENIPKDLLVAADKYALDRLKAMCEEHILSNLSVVNAGEIMNLAQKHNAEQLKARVTDFMITHVINEMDVNKWRAMILRNPHLVTEVFQDLITQKTPYAS